MKIALVTGGSSPMGQSIAETLYKNGFRVYLAFRDKSGDTTYGDIIPVVLDVTSTENCNKVIEDIEKAEGRLDVLVNVAGNSSSSPLIESKVEDFENLLKVNTIGHFNMAKAAYSQLKKSQGKIINITSMSGLVTFPNFGFYSASKFAAEALDLALRYEVKKEGVYVTNIEPGAIERKDNSKGKLPHKSAREKFKILRTVLPFAKDKDVADAVLKVVNNSKPPARVTVGADAKIIYLLNRFLPNSLWDYLIDFVWNKK